MSQIYIKAAVNTSTCGLFIQNNENDWNPGKY